ncbi:MAG: heavy metal translocating P-type ATPase [Flavobacterium sp.]
MTKSNENKNSKKCCGDDDSHNHSEHNHDHNHSDHDGHGHSHDLEDQSKMQLFGPAIISFVLLMVGIALDYYLKPEWFTDNVRLVWYSIAYVPVGIPVLKEALENIKRGEVFSEFFLMGIATIGAFGIGEYPEGVAVMLFYAIGEIFQTLAVTRAKTNIKTLLDQRPDEATIILDGTASIKKAKEIEIGEVVQLKSGEKLAIDGILLSDSGSFNTAALTGESAPTTYKKGQQVLAGMINLQTVSLVESATKFEDTKLSKILQMVQEASTKKAPTELFIRKFAKIYTPIVVYLALAICFIPYFFVEDYIFRDWLYRALIFLVISCPCALVISIPLGYFGGIGAASRNGILFKGSVFLDIMANIGLVVTDKTGTMTEGVFKVQKIESVGISEEELIKFTAALEHKSTHPIGAAIIDYAKGSEKNVEVSEVEEIAGHGLIGKVDSRTIAVGNTKLLDKLNISYDKKIGESAFTIIAVAIDNKYAGHILIADRIKSDAALTVAELKKLGVKTIMLSGDKDAVVQAVAKELKIEESYGDLLPEHKVQKMESFKSDKLKIAFVGDGVNDAPVVALADAGIAMGGLGSDATIETADIVIQNDQPYKIVTAIKIGKKTKQIVWQNITIAFLVKAVVLILGAGGLATMWEAVFADVGVALIAILNAMRIQNSKF